MQTGGLDCQILPQFQTQGPIAHKDIWLGTRFLMSNRQGARPLRTRPHKRVTLIMVGLLHD